ncbi:MAG: hypothetical protein NZM04_07410 [Methylacidiphilales bacterium]|nr:hypothetical protein [Candidatus Methylacidiphilales bacterium]MDW8349208.1 hypothetical protein [Verrucomicrobiae bacterium]
MLYNMKQPAFYLPLSLAICVALGGCAQQQPTWGGARGPDMRVGIGVGTGWGSRSSGIGVGVGTSVSFPIGTDRRSRDQRELQEYRAYLRAMDLTNQERQQKKQKPLEIMTFEQWRAARERQSAQSQP